jgi:hypothetical protein
VTIESAGTPSTVGTTKTVRMPATVGTPVRVGTQAELGSDARRRTAREGCLKHKRNFTKSCYKNEN